MKKYFIKRAIKGEPVEYYGRESDWTTDRNQADGYANRYTAENVILGDCWLNGAYVSCEDVKLRSEIVLEAIQADMKRLTGNIEELASIAKAMEENNG